MKHIICTSLVLLYSTGCVTRSFTNTDRNAIEQLLLSGAVDNALEELNIPEVVDKKTYIDFTNLKSYDVEYVKAAMRVRFAEIGAHLVECAEQADCVVEIASGALGTEYKSNILGIPSIPIPGSPVALPEIALFQSVEQTGIAKLLVLVRCTDKLVTVGHYYGKVDRNENFVFFHRWQPKDDIRTRWKDADQKIKANRYKRRIKFHETEEYRSTSGKDSSSRH